MQKRKPSLEKFEEKNKKSSSKTKITYEICNLLWLAHWMEIKLVGKYEKWNLDIIS